MSSCTSSIPVDINKVREQIIALQDAIAQGATSVRYQDKMVTYRSIADMIRTIDYLKGLIGEGCSSAFGSNTVINDERL